MILTYFVYIVSIYWMSSIGRDSSALMSRGRTVAANGKLWIAITYFTIIAGLRWNTGFDYMSYLGEYASAYHTGYVDRSWAEPFFIYICETFGRLQLHFFFYFAFWAFLQIYFFSKAAKQEYCILPFLLPLIFLDDFFIDWMNGLRQCVVECVLFWSMTFIRDRRFISYIAILAIASTLHSSALLMLPLVILYYVPTYTNNKVLIPIVLLATVLGQTPTWISSIEVVAQYFEVLGMERYATDVMLAIDREESVAWGPSRIAIYLVNLIILMNAEALRKRFDNPKSIYKYCYLMFVIYFITYNLFVQTSHIFIRLIEYFAFFRLPMAAYMCLYLKEKHKSYFVLFLILISIPVIVGVLKGGMVKDSPLLYRFFFLENVKF